MKYVVFLVCFAYSLGGYAHGPGETSKNALDSETVALIFNYVKGFPDSTEASIALLNNGEVQYFGLRKVNDTIVEVSNSKHMFEIGSLTKVFTSTLMVVAEDKGMLKLDDPISAGLPDSISITFKQLANHTSGLPVLPSNLDLETVNEDDPYVDYDSKMLDEYLTKEIVLNQNPEIGYEYSNLGAGLLGHVVSVKMGDDYGSLLEKHIFSAYNMPSSSVNENEVKGTKIKGRSPEGKVVPYWHFDALAGAGAIVSNVEDLTQFAHAQFDASNAVLAKTRDQTFAINEQMSIGLGWHLIAVGENTWCWHNGGTAGFSTSMALDVKQKKGVIILSNVSAFHERSDNIDALCFAILGSMGN